MGTGRPDEIDQAACLPSAGPPTTTPTTARNTTPSALRTAARRPADGDRTLVLDAGGENVIVVLGEEAGDAGEIWTFIRQRMAVRNRGLM
jgi:hypothetical protein